MQSSQARCLVCGGNSFESVYRGPIRAGQWGKSTGPNQEVIACNGCRLTRLAEFPDQSDFYQTGEYRESYNGSFDVRENFRLHDHLQSARIAKIGVEHFRDARVLDYGCGAGLLLDIVSGMAAGTFGIEPCAEYHSSLKERGHAVFPSGVEAARELKSSIDVALSICVIEHVPDPLEYLREVHQTLKSGGELYIETDNLKQLLMQAGTEEFKSFYFRTAHLWYFTTDSLLGLCKKAGFELVQSDYRNTYDISNSLLWLRDRKPTGFDRLGLFDERANQTWRNMLEVTGLADLIWLRLKKV